jgi:hypothetical protein
MQGSRLRMNPDPRIQAGFGLTQPGRSLSLGFRLDLDTDPAWMNPDPRIQAGMNTDPAWTNSDPRIQAGFRH